jgi:putative flavoprotein involved in K+ transport
VTEVTAAIVGGGQAGLATSWWLQQRGIDHVVLDRGQVGDTWRNRWDSFCLVTPNWTLDLPGFPYRGSDPDGFLLRDDIVQYVEAYAASFDPPLRNGVEVGRIHRQGAGWSVVTDTGTWSADNVVVATGSYTHPRLPSGSAHLAPSVTQIHSSEYRRAGDLPNGAVLVVGSGQSGGQITEDLWRAGREVWLSVGSAARIPRRYRGRDTSGWLIDSGFADVTIDTHPLGAAVRRMPHPHVSGRDGGKDINLRAFGRDGVHLVGHFDGAAGTRCRFRDDVVDMLDAADDFAAELAGRIDGYIEEAGIDAPADDAVPVTWSPQECPTAVDLATAGIGTVIWATGYRSDFSVVDAPVFDDAGYPVFERGVTELPGLYFVGLHWLHTAGSALFAGVGADAEHVVDHLAAR